MGESTYIEHAGLQSMGDIKKHAMCSPADRESKLTRRKSYDSIRENYSQNTPQSFIHRSDLQSIDETLLVQQPQIVPYWEKVPTNPFKSWKSSKPKKTTGRQSNSSVDLRRLWSWTSNLAGSNEAVAPTVSLEQMPFEILELIFSHLTSDIRPDSYAPRNVDLIACLQSSRTIAPAALSVLYRNVAIPHSMTFAKLLKRISQDSELGPLVKRLDFSHYTAVGFGRTRQTSAAIQNVTARTIDFCLDLMPKIQEFLVHEHIDDELDSKVLAKLFSLPSIQALDFCACSSSFFVKSFTSALTLSETQSLTSLRRLSLHECTTLRAPVFKMLLSRLDNLTHLDVAHTLITNEALFVIPRTARLTHLNLSRCTRMTGDKVVEFLTTHPAASYLVYLNLFSDASRYRLLAEEDVSTLLANLPPTVRSLNLGGAYTTTSHISALRPLMNTLEELGLAHAPFDIHAINELVMPAGIRPLSIQTSIHPSADQCSLHYIDIRETPYSKQMSLSSSECVLTTSLTNLEVIEVEESAVKRLRVRYPSNSKSDWVVRDLGRRSWYVRQISTEDDGRRPWKMGARWWGTNKIPVADQEVGGMYGHYMFKN